jgi:hypothetical protein
MNDHIEILQAEIDYVLYRLKALNEEPDRIRSYREKIEEQLRRIRELSNKEV